MRLATLAALIALAAPFAARAEAPCPPRLTPGKAVALEAPLDEHDRLGLGWAAILGLSPPSREWPWSSFAHGSACSAGDFKIGETTWTLHRGTGDAPAMWARPASGDGMAFLALAPSLDEGFDYSQTNPRPEPLELHHPGYLLVVAHQRNWFLTRVYDALPPPAQVMADMAAGLKGQTPLIATFDPDGAAISFSMATQSDARAILAEPKPGQGGMPARLWAPDNELYQRMTDGSVRMAGSGFLCPKAAAGFPLSDLWVANVTELRRDLSCRYIGSSPQTQGAWISIFVTRRPEHPPLKTIYDGYVEEIRGQHTLAAPATAPLAAGPPQKPAYAGAWTTAEGSGEGLWVAAVGDWYIEVRATYATGQADTVGAAVAELFAQVYRTIPSPAT
jgi:hypothetical protein